jgi:hypothetical protein
MPLSTILQLYLGGQFYWRRKPEYPEKTTIIWNLKPKILQIQSTKSGITLVRIVEK